MIFKRLTIKNFGKIHDKTVEFSQGINILYGENESGKSTVHTFVRSMLYGITRQRGRASRNDIYTRYEPWENPAQYGGSLWFSTGGEDYRLTRNFYKENQNGELLNLRTGELTGVEDGQMEQLLGGVSQAVYDNTVSVAQLKSVTGKDLASEVQNYMASYQGTGDSSVDLGRTMQMLKMSRKGYQVQKDKKRKEAEKEQEKLNAKMEYLNRELEELKERQSQVSRKEEKLQIRSGEERGLDMIEGKIQALRKRRLALTAAALLAVILGIVGLFSRFSAADQITRLGWDFCILLGIGMILYYLGRRRMLDRDLASQNRLRTRWLQQQEKLKWNKESLQESFEEKRVDFENLQEEYKDYESEIWMPVSEDIEIQALNLAMDTIEQISGNIHRQVGYRLRQRTSQILCEITDGRYQEVLIDPDLQISVNTSERIIPAQRLSRGTIEQLYFALRMAASELLCGGETFPVILDDVFGMYDEARLAAVLHWLEKEQKQVIISTCNKREAQILEREGIPYRLQSLSEE
ncbi:MAG: AAA family ATPase [Blautia sp.]|nr:AAA family ATPase [Blautia sp.]